MIDSLIYISQANIPFEPGDCAELARKAANNNARLHITGYLSFNRGFFFQYLEGARNRLSPLLEVIKADSRHQVLRVFDLGQTELPRFPQWSMRLMTGKDTTMISLESVLEQALEGMLAPPATDEAMVKTLCRLIDAIAVRNLVRPPEP